MSHDVAVKAACGVDHQPKCRVDDRARLFGIEILPELGRIHDVDEQRRNHFAFALWNGLSFDGSAEGETEDRRLGRIDRVGSRRGGGCWPSEAPHSLQNFAVVRLGAPQAGQCNSKAVPQASQNLAASEFRESQLGHRMT